MEKKRKSCACLKIDASLCDIQQNKNLKMTTFEWVFFSCYFKFGLSISPHLPPA
jgi:hypothetical protein